MGGRDRGNHPKHPDGDKLRGDRGAGSVYGVSVAGSEVELSEEITTGNKIGPNVRRLIAHKMSLLAIPAGSGKDSMALGVEMLTNPKKLASTAAEATDWVQKAIAVMKTAPDNPYKDDEEIVAAILAGIEARSQLKPTS